MEKSNLDDTDILQIDGTVITGLLVLLTLTSIIPVESAPLKNIFVILLTAFGIIPFATSAVMVLSKHIETTKQQRVNKLIYKPIDKVKNYSAYARIATFYGFVYLILVMVILYILNSLYMPKSPIIEVCQKHHELFNMTWDDCANIKQGSLYEECVNKAVPNIQNVTACHKFMVE